MCGICGTYDANALLSKEERDQVVRKMNDALTHRGPDESGFYSSESCTLAMRRLSIIDLEGGQQPVFNEDKSICIFYNGEVYNFQELKEGLLERGHVFRTHSDTEVIVHLYEDYGEKMVGQLKGMFAFCIYDFKKEKLFLARDRFGEKPLFYHHNDGFFAFSSEIKSLLEHPKVPRKLDRKGLQYFLQIGYVPDPFTLLDKIHSLPPGHHLTFENGKIKTASYFEVDYKIDENLKSEEDAVAYLTPILEKAVKRQTVSDVPIGAFLSGGIDSSTVVAMLQSQSAEKIKTFTVKFEESTYDESGIAREVANHLGTDHHEIVIPNQDFDESLFWNIIDHVGMPFSDTSAIPTYMITKEIRKYVKVALSGDGGDELFGGYPEFQWIHQVLKLKSMPKGIRSLAKKVLESSTSLPGLSSSSILRKLRKATDLSLQEEYDIPLALYGLFQPGERKALLNGQANSKNAEQYRTFPERAASWTSLRKLMYFRLIHFLPLDMLVKVDRMSMANSLEVRAPFLDADLFEASCKLPGNFLVQNGKGKHIIRKIMVDKLPPSVFNHPKMGFAIPLFKYQNEAYHRLADKLFNHKNPLAEILDMETVFHIKKTGLSASKDNAKLSVYKASHQVWSLMQLFGWMERFKIEI